MNAFLTSTALVALTHGTAFAQTATSEAPAEGETTSDEIVVIGTQIQGAQINDVLPVTVLTETDIETTGASSGDELFRAIPQAGTVAFNEQNATTQNSARGDVGSINLRDLGTGNTLLLINGRRMAQNLADRWLRDEQDARGGTDRAFAVDVIEHFDMSQTHGVRYTLGAGLNNRIRLAIA